MASSRFIGSLFFLGIFILIDVYAYGAFKAAFGNKPWVKPSYWIFHGSVYVAMLIFSIQAYRGVMPRPWIYDFYSVILALYIGKLLLVSLLLLEDITRLGRWIWGFLFGAKEAIEGSGVKITRAQFFSQTALLLASIPFGGMLYGILKGKYDFQVRKVVLEFANLPEAFHGMTIAQVSDIHVGTFDNTNGVKKGVELLLAQKADMIFFTGDLINNHISEMEGFEEIFSSFTAPQGVYSVLGNHDYGDYIPFESKEAKAEHFEEVKAMHKKLGWDLMLNENRIIEKNGQKIALIGVENWGNSFSKHGRMDLAVAGVEDVPFKLLLSHDPTHWDAVVRPQYPDVSATFSGHTHGFQLGVEIPGLRFSPAQWRYRQWGGLYREGEQLLYVNRGFGCMGFSGRAGIWPEITVFELRKVG